MTTYYEDLRKKVKPMTKYGLDKFFCPACNEQVDSRNTTTCEHCGEPLRRRLPPSGQKISTESKKTKYADGDSTYGVRWTNL